MINWLKRLFNNSIKYNKDKRLQISNILLNTKHKKKNKTIGFLIVSDVHELHEKMIEELNKKKDLNFDFIVSLGDIQIDALKTLVKFAKNKNVPLFAIRGNHDTYQLEDIDDYIINIDEKIVDINDFKFIGVEGCLKYNDNITSKDDEKLFNKHINEDIDVIFSHNKAYAGYDEDVSESRQGLLGINKIMANGGVIRHFYGHFHNDSKMNNINNTPSQCIYMVKYIRMKY